MAGHPVPPPPPLPREYRQPTQQPIYELSRRERSPLNVPQVLRIFGIAQAVLGYGLAAFHWGAIIIDGNIEGALISLTVLGMANWSQPMLIGSAGVVIFILAWRMDR